MGQELGKTIRIKILKTELKKSGLDTHSAGEIAKKTENDLISVLMEAKMFEDLKHLLHQLPTLSNFVKNGYIVDPFAIDINEKCSFYRALDVEWEDAVAEIIFHLYCNAAGLIPLTDISCNDEQQENIRVKLEAITENISQLSSERSRFIYVLLMFQKFQCKVGKALKEVPEDENKVYEEAKKEKSIIEKILSMHQHVDTDCLKFYSDERVFNNMVDFYTLLLLCKNLFGSKQQNLTLDEQTYEQIEVALCRFMFGCKFHSEGVDQLVFLNRWLMNRDLQKFRNVLQNANITMSNIEKRLPSIYTTLNLNSLKNIRDVFILKQMLHHINLAIEYGVKKEHKSGIMMSDENDENEREGLAPLIWRKEYKERILVTERALLNIADTIQFLKKENSASLGVSLLLSCLPQENMDDLMMIRDSLCRSANVQEKEKTEDDIFIFYRISKDLRNIKLILDGILRDLYYAIGFCTLDTVSEKLKENDGTDDSDRIYVFSKSLKDSCELNLEFSHASYKEHIEIHLDYLKDLELADLNEKNIYFKCIIFLLNYIVKRSKMDSEKKAEFEVFLGSSILDMTQQDKMVLENMKKKFYHLQWLSDELYSALKISNEVYRGGDFLKPETFDDSVFRMEFSFFTKMKKSLTTQIIFSDQEKEDILRTVGQIFRDLHNAKITLSKTLNGTGEKPEDIEKEISKLLLPEAEKADLKNNFNNDDFREKNLIIIESAKVDYTHYRTLKDAFCQNVKLIQGEFSTICNDLQLPPKTKKELRFFAAETKETKDPELLQHLKKRISDFQEIIINYDPNLPEMWLRAENKDAVSHQLKGHCLRYPKLLAAAQMNLFHCLNILERHDNLKELCLNPYDISNAPNIPNTTIFNAINLRNVIADGDPLYLGTVEMLDPDDLIGRMIKEILNLVADLEAIEAMCQLLKESGAKRETFLNIVNEENLQNCKEIFTKIKKCEKWEDYARLIHTTN